ncbi:DEAD/DEAH box helicase [Hamiltosporidium magnivora]|uniref:ATP-dependent RNA helicase n=1 Tax=Hamiltosporidium magnivora TaxID=148818 RepID=A0A4Q9LEP6_9MICR|nr:DEAD/DEAH box helicase [Hamiltosporidium magnivora]
MEFTKLEITENIKYVLNENGFSNSTEVQQKVIPLFLKKKDLIVKAMTGSGKTLSFLIPIANFLDINTSKVIKCIIISPTRELANQIAEVVKMFKSVSSYILIGGEPIENDLKIIDSSEINTLIVTPGRFNEIINLRPEKFKSVEYLILDEADKLLSIGFKVSVLNIISKLPKNRTTCLFSATIDKSILNFTKLNLKNPISVSINSDIIPDKLKIYYIKTSPKHKLSLLKNFLEKKSIIFFTTCAQVDFFYDLFTKMNISGILRIHRKVKQIERNKIYENFHKTGRWLFCTDVASRGIDFKNIYTVTHYDIPVDPLNFFHRSGRTGRNGNTGEVFLFLMENEIKYINYLKIKNIDTEEYECKDTSKHTSNIEIDNEITELATKAVISYLRSYKEHTLSYLLNIKDLNQEEIAQAYFLKKIPENIFYTKNKNRFGIYKTAKKIKK